MTPRSCEISISAMPRSATSSLIRSRICALDGHVQRRGRLVGDQQVGPAGQRHGDHDALALAAGKLVRIGVDAPRRVGNADAIEQRERLLARLRRPTCRDAARSGSATWRPMLCTGLSAVIGSWKIMPMRSPRMRHISRVALADQLLAVEADAAGTCAPSGSRPISAIAVIDLPQPDSPTKPERLAALERKAHVAHGVGRAAVRLQPHVKVVDFEQRASSLPRQARIEQVAQAVAQQVQAEHGQRDRQPGKTASSGAWNSSVCASLSMRPQRRLRRLRAEAEVATARPRPGSRSRTGSSPARSAPTAMFGSTCSIVMLPRALAAGARGEHELARPDRVGRRRA